MADIVVQLGVIDYSCTHGGSWGRSS